MASMTVEKYIDKTLKLLEKERTAEINETSLLQEQVPLKELQRKGVCVLKLRIANRHTGLYGRTVLQFEPLWETKELPSHNFTPGDIAGVHLSQGGTSPSDQLSSGIVARIGQRFISVAFDESHDQLELDDNAQYKLLKLANDVTYKRLKKALETLNHDRDSFHLVGVLFGQTEPGPPLSKARDGQEHELHYVNPHLDPSQREAVRFALSQPDVAIIHGPPGTGKTTTVTELIVQAVKQGLKLLVCAPSNIAVDNLTEKLSAYKTRMVRIGHPARVLPSIQSYSLDAVLRASDEAQLTEDVRRDLDKTLARLKKTSDRGARQQLKEELRHLRREYRERERRALEATFSRVRVVLATLTMASTEGPLRHVQRGEFDLVVIDECSQAMEAACWIALQHAPRCILAGDHNQLPPTIVSHEAAKEGLALTLMERLLSLHGDSTMRMLTTQYRMHEDIMIWPSEQLYDGKLTAHESVAKHLLKDLPGVADTDVTTTPLLLIDTAGSDLWEVRVQAGGSTGNEGEADIVAAHVGALVEAGLPAGDIAVIAPYNLQVELLRLRLSPRYPGLEIKSVDGFQGREKEAVVISLVRSNEKGEVGFLAENRRINVAVTRARRHLAVVCDTETVGHHDFLRELTDFMCERGEVRSAHTYIQEGVLSSETIRPDYLTNQLQTAATASPNTGPQTRPRTGDTVRQPRQRTARDRPQGRKDEDRGNNDTQRDAEKQPSQVDDTSAEDTEKYLLENITNFKLDTSEERMEFPSSLSGLERKLVHQICEGLDLLHVSEGVAPNRYITVSKPQQENTNVVKSSGSTSEASRTSSKPSKTSETKPASANVVKSASSTSEASRSSSKPSKTNDTKPASAKKSENSISASDAKKHSTGDSKRHETTEVVANESDSSKPKDSASDTKICDKCAKDIPSANFELHQLRCIGIAPPKSAKSDDTGARPKNKKKPKQKQPKPNTKEKEEEDFDAIIADAQSQNSKCNFAKCKKNVQTLGQNCPFCAQRFCLTHFIAEGHGCGDAAKARARHNIRKEGKIYSGSGIPNKKPDAIKRSHLERNMEKKLSEMSDKRKVKKKAK